MAPLRALSVTLLLLVVAGWSMGQEAPADTQHTTLEDSDCWDCHRPGAYDPDMDPSFQLIPQEQPLVAGETFTLKVQAQNTWITPTNGFEISNWRVALDIGGAPSLGFVSNTPPVEGATWTGSIPFDPAGVATALAADPTYLTQPISGYTVIEVPDAATDLNVEIAPDDRDALTGPDITVNIYPGRSTPEGDPARTLNDAGPGGAEVLHLSNPLDFSELGYGNWTIEVLTTPAPTGGQPYIPSGDIPFTVTLDALFEASTQTIQVRSEPSIVTPGQGTILSWDLEVREATGFGEGLVFYVNATTHYDHEADGTVDWWDIEFPPYVLDFDVGATGATIGTGTIALVDTQASLPGVSLAAISEAIGYAAALLLVISLITGGMFGKRTRRWQNKVFGSAKRRVAFHNFLSYGIIATALVHFVLFLVEINYHWTVGLIWGGLGILCMLLLGVTGAMQVPMIRRWNYSVWRWSHFYLAIGAVVFTIVHMLLDGENFSFVSEALDYVDPIVPKDRQ